MRTVQIPPKELKRLSLRSLTIAHGCRALDTKAPKEQIEGIYLELARVLGQTPEVLRAHAPPSEGSTHQTFAQPPAIAYPKAWEKVNRRLYEFVDHLAAGELSSALSSLAALEIGIAAIPPLRLPFLEALGLEPQSTYAPAGISPEEATAYFIRPGSKHLGQTLPTHDRIAGLFSLADRPMETALGALGAGNYGSAAETLRAALGMDPGHGDGRVLLGELLRRMDQPRAARGELCFMIEQELAGARLLQGQGARLGSQIRLARAYVSLGRLALDAADLPGAKGAFEAAYKHLDWVERRGNDGGLGAQDMAHVASERSQCQERLARLQ